MNDYNNLKEEKGIPKTTLSDMISDTNNKEDIDKLKNDYITLLNQNNELQKQIEELKQRQESDI